MRKFIAALHISILSGMLLGGIALMLAGKGAGFVVIAFASVYYSSLAEATYVRR